MFRLSSGLRVYVAQCRNSCPVLGGDRGKGVSPLDDLLKRDHVKVDVWEGRSGKHDLCMRLQMVGWRDAQSLQCFLCNPEDLRSLLGASRNSQHMPVIPVLEGFTGHLANNPSPQAPDTHKIFYKNPVS